MSHFYGTLKGSRGPATRCGTKTSGIRVSAQSYTGSITVQLQEKPGGTYYWISCRNDSGSGGNLIAHGWLSKLVADPEPFDPQGVSCRQCNCDIKLLRDNVFCEQCFDAEADANPPEEEIA